LCFPAAYCLAANPVFCAALLLEILAFVLGLGVRCWSGESTDQTLHSDLNIAAVIRVLLSQSGFARPWIHCSAVPSCCWRISLYCSYFSHRQDDVRDKTRGKFVSFLARRPCTLMMFLGAVLIPVSIARLGGQLRLLRSSPETGSSSISCLCFLRKILLHEAIF
jgi:hypothetical protein